MLIFLLVSFAVTFMATVGIAVKLMTMEISELSAIFILLRDSLCPPLVTIYPLPGVPFHFCAATNLPSWFYVYWIPFMVFETLLFVLALVKWCTSVQFRFANGSVSGKTLLDCLVQDSILYFTV